MQKPWENKYDNIWETKFAHLWVVGNGTGKIGVYDSNSDTIIVPLVYNSVWSTPSPNLWIIIKNWIVGVHDSSKKKNVVPLIYDNIWYTKFPNLWIVEKDGMIGVSYNKSHVFTVPIMYDSVWETNLSNMWIIYMNGKWGIYCSDMRHELLPPIFHDISREDLDILSVYFSARTKFDFNLKECLWVLPQDVVAYCKKYKKNFLIWACLYTLTPEMVLRP